MIAILVAIFAACLLLYNSYGIWQLDQERLEVNKFILMVISFAGVLVPLETITSLSVIILSEDTNKIPDVDVIMVGLITLVAVSASHLRKSLSEMQSGVL